MITSIGHGSWVLLMWMWVVAGCSPTTLVNALTPKSGYVLSKDIAYGDQARQTLSVYAPDRHGDAHPVVVYFYGGRWTRGSKQHYRFVAQALVSRGFVAVLPDYRTYPQVTFPTFVEDAASAVAWAHEHIARFGGDPNKLFLMGHSSGAHIAAMLTLDERYLQDVGGDNHWLSGMVGLAGPYDFLPLEEDDLKAIFGPPARYELSQPITFVDGKEPPMLLMHGLKDESVWVRNTRNLAAKIDEKGGTVKTVYYPSMGHLRIVAALAAPLRRLGPVLDDATAFMRGVAE